MQRRSFLLLIGLGLGACTAGRRLAGPLPGPPLDGPYRLDSGDRLRVTVFEQPSLTNVYAVDQAGYVSFPLVGAIAARGRTTPELAAAIAARLNKGFLKNADVSVEIDTYRPFFIMGEVRNPGQYTYVPGLTAETAIAIAGGFTARADDGSVEITRQINGKLHTGTVPPSAAVRPGDVLKIARRLF